MSFVVFDHHKCAKQITIQEQQKTTTTTKQQQQKTTNYNNNKHSTNVMDNFVPCTRAWAKFGKRHNLHHSFFSYELDQC